MESLTGTSATTRRWLAMIAVVALHALFLYAIERMRGRRHEIDIDIEASLVMVRIFSLRARERVVQPARRESPVTRERRAQESRRSSVPTEQRMPPSSSPVSTPNPSTPSVPSPPRAIDWRANAARSAQVVVEGSLEPGPRSFGPREQLEQRARVPDSVFGPGPKHQPGEIGVDAYGDPALWLNDSCYQELEKPVPTARDVFVIVPLVKCMLSIGSREPNGKLFEHIKKREEPPVPKASTEMNP